jgi:hypothetical protein
VPRAADECSPHHELDAAGRRFHGDGLPYTSEATATARAAIDSYSLKSCSGTEQSRLGLGEFVSAGDAEGATMFRVAPLITASALMLSSGAVNANTFDITGTFSPTGVLSGRVEIDDGELDGIGRLVYASFSATGVLVNGTPDNIGFTIAPDPSNTEFFQPGGGVYILGYVVIYDYSPNGADFSLFGAGLTGNMNVSFGARVQ